MMDIVELDQRLDAYVELLEEDPRPLPERLIAAGRILAELDPGQVEGRYRALVEAMQHAVAAAYAEAGLSAEASLTAADPATLQDLSLSCAAEASGLQAEMMILHDPSMLDDLEAATEDRAALTAVTHQIGLWLLEGKGKKSAANRLRDSGASKAECRDMVAVVDAILVEHFGKGYEDKPAEERAVMVEEWEVEFGEEGLFEDTEIREITENEAVALAKQMKGWVD